MAPPGRGTEGGRLDGGAVDGPGGRRDDGVDELGDAQWWRVEPEGGAERDDLRRDESGSGEDVGPAEQLARGEVGGDPTDLRSAYHTDVVIGVEDAAAEQGLEVVISHGRRDPAMLAERLDALVRLGIDAAVVVSAHAPARALAAAADAVPTVVVGRPRRLPSTVSRVCNDDEAGARLAVEHLIAQGHTRIAYLQSSRSAAALARRDAYRRVLAEHDLPELVVEDPADLAVTDAAAVTAVFASNDRGAGSVLGWSYDVGRRVPDDLAVVGYDDTELATTVRPTLTSIDQPRLEMGRRALEIVSGDDVVREVFAPSLVVRASSVRDHPKTADGAL